MDLICPQCSRVETDPYEIDDLCSCGSRFVLTQSAPSSALEGFRISYHYDGNFREWVVRIHHPKGMMSLCACEGEEEAKVVSACLAAVIATADCTFSITENGGKTEKIECRNFVEFDAMRDYTTTAAELVRQFVK